MPCSASCRSSRLTFATHGMAATFIGHPASGQVKSLADGQAFRAEHGIPDEAFVLGALFGSRFGELDRMGNIIIAAVQASLVRAPAPFHVIAPTLPHLRDRVGQMLASLPVTSHIIDHDKWRAFAAMDAAVAVSGTVGLELALSGVPHVIAYRANALTASIVRCVIRVRYAHLANILFDREIVPEFIQKECEANAIAATLVTLFNRDGAAATAQRTEFFNLRRIFSGQDASAKAAEFIFGLLLKK